MIYTQALEVNLSAGELGTNQMAHDKLFDLFMVFKLQIFKPAHMGS
jgi:hypothetical protein